MNKKRMMKRIFSLLCALVLSVSTAIAGVPSQASAGSSVLPPTDFTELTWEDFSGLKCQKYVAPNPDTTGAAGIYSGDLNRTLLNGNILMGANTDMRFAGGGWSGLIIRAREDGMLVIDSSTFDTGYANALEPAAYGLESFIGEEFNLKISTEINGNDYTFGVWVNDIMAGDYFTLTETNDGEKGNKIGLYDEGSGNNITLKYATVAVPTDFAELGWTNFYGLNYQEYVAPVPDSGAKGVYRSTMDETLLNGDIIMGEGSDLRFAGTEDKNGWYGMIIHALSDGSICVENSMYDTSYGKIFYPSAFGLTSFVDTRFNLKISTEIDGNNYTFGIWINDQILGDYFTLVEEGTDAGSCVGLYKRDGENNITLLRAEKEIPTDFTKLRWTDFAGFEYKEYTTPKGHPGTYAGSLDKTLLNGEIIMGADTDIRVASQTSNPGWSGFIFKATSSGYLIINASTFDNTFDHSYNPADYGLTSFVDTQFNLKISTEVKGNNRTFVIWVNDILLDYFTLVESDGDAGSIIGLYDNEVGNNITLIQTPVVIPTDFTKLNWAEFTGLEYKEYVAPNPAEGAVGTYENSLNRTLFDGNIILGVDTDIRYAGQTSNPGWSGMIISAAADGRLIVNNSTFETVYSEGYEPSAYGLTSFVGEEFNLKISTEISGTNYTFGIWVNDKIVGDYFTLTGPEDNGMATLGVYDRETGNNVTLKRSPSDTPVDFADVDWTGYEVLTPLTSYGLEATTYTMAENESIDRDLLSPMEKLDNVIMQFHEITYTGDIDLGFGGGNVWTGFRLRSDSANGTLILRSGYSKGGAVNQLIAEPIVLTDGISGVDLVGGTYNLKISMTYTDANTIQMGLWFNNKLYNNRYVKIDLSGMDDYETGDVLGTHFGVVCQSTTGGAITWKENVVTLDNAYWNKAEGALVAPENATDGQGNSITELSSTGDYFITFHTGGTIYNTNVYVWLAGDVDTDDEINLHDLIRIKRLMSGDEDGTTNAGKKGADLDANSTIDETDADSLRELLMSLMTF